MLTKDLNLIIDELTANNIISIPTDTVYGLSCCISNIAINKLVNIKKRDPSKGFIIISHNSNHLLKFVDTSKLSDEQIKQICSSQTLPTTWIVPAKRNIQWLTGNKPTVAIRLVDTEIIKNICSKIDDAIISTSANISGYEFINNAKAIDKIFSDIYVLETQVKSSQPSRIIDIMSNKRIR